MENKLGKRGTGANSIQNAVIGVLGFIIIVYLVTGLFNDVGGNAQNVNTSYTGGSLVRTLFPLLFAVGSIIMALVMMLKGK